MAEYKNAAEILPEKLIREIRRYFPGGLLWVPKTGEHHRLRRELILKLLEKGESVKDVAALSGYSKRQIWTLKKSLKQRGKAGDAEGN